MAKVEMTEVEFKGVLRALEILVSNPDEALLHDTKYANAVRVGRKFTRKYKK